MIIQNNSTNNYFPDPHSRLLLPTGANSQKDMGAADNVVNPEGSTKNLIARNPSGEKLDLHFSNVTEIQPQEFQLVNGIYLPLGVDPSVVLRMPTAEELARSYETSKTASFLDKLEYSLDSIVKAESQNPNIRDINEFFGRLADLSSTFRRDNMAIYELSSSSKYPLVMNRETYDKTNDVYTSLLEFSLSEPKLKQLEKILLDSLKLNENSYNSESKRFALRFLANTVFIENFYSDKLTEKVIEGLKTDKEDPAKLIYEYYLTQNLDNLALEQKQTVLDILEKNSRLSSHLAQSIIIQNPDLKKDISQLKFPEIINYEGLEKILEDLSKYTKLANNQTDLIPSAINPDKNYGIEIELKLRGSDNSREDDSPIRRDLKAHEDFIELGTDFNDAIAELRTLEGGFKLNQENYEKLFEIVNTIHKSPDLVSFLSQHIHLDNEYRNYQSPFLLNFIHNGLGTLETKSLNLNSTILDGNNNLLYSYSVSNFVDQMIALEELKNIKSSPDSYIKSFQLSEKFGIPQEYSYLLCESIANNKSHIIPNLLRLHSDNKDYIDIKAPLHQAIETLDLKSIQAILNGLSVEQADYVINKADKDQENALILATKMNNSGIVKILLNKLSSEGLSQALNKTNGVKHNALMIAAEKDDPEILKLILDKLSKEKLAKEFERTSNAENNILMVCTLFNSNPETIKLLLSNLSVEQVSKALEQLSCNKQNALMLAVNNKNPAILDTLLQNLSNAQILKALKQIDLTGNNALKVAFKEENPQYLISFIKRLTTDELKSELEAVGLNIQNKESHRIPVILSYFNNLIKKNFFFNSN